MHLSGRFGLKMLGKKDGAAYRFRDRRGNGVSDASISVHPKGKPISASVKFGWMRQPWSPTSSCTLETIDFLYRPVRSCIGIPNPRPSIEAVGVGHNEHASSHVWRPHGARGYNRPLSVIPDSGQISANGRHASPEKRGDIFHEDVGGSKLANKTGVLAPKSRPSTFNAGAFACVRDVLAREPAANNVDCSDMLGLQLSNVAVDGNAGPMLGEHAARELLDLAEGHRLETARPLKPQAEAADAAEKIENAQLPRGRRRMFVRTEYATRQAPPTLPSSTRQGGHAGTRACLRYRRRARRCS